MRPTTNPVAILNGGAAFPDPRHARWDGLVAVGGELSLDRLIAAYSHGIFPWTVDPVTWWSPDPRAIFDLENIHVPRRLRSAVDKHPYRVTFDAAFDAVIEACSEAPRWGDETWITPEFIAAYQAFHRAGFAHSIELWHEGELVAGLYGVAIGGFFAGESMFHTRTNASKIALVLLQHHLRAQGFVLFDTQMFTPVTQIMGAQLIPRDEYLARLQQALTVKAKFAA